MSRAIQSLLLALAVSTAVQAITDTDILNFALNLEYLEANFYHCAVYGTPIPSNMTGGGPTPTGCKKAALSSDGLYYATTVAKDEVAHVALLRAALGSAAVPQPQLNIGTAFVAAANAAFNTTLIPSFDAYANDLLFFHAAFIFEDLGVTAYKGAAPLLTSKAILGTAAGIMAIEAYHAGSIRSLLLSHANEYVFPYGAQVKVIVGAISALRASASKAMVDAPLISTIGGFVVAAADYNSVAYSRTPAQVMAVATLGGAGNKGGFFPNGLNGNIKQINC